MLVRGYPSGASLQISSFFSLSICCSGSPADMVSFSHVLWITVCEHIFGGSVDYLRITHCSGGTYCDTSDYDAPENNIVSKTAISSDGAWANHAFMGVRSSEEDLFEGFEVALIGPGGTYGLAYSLDVDPTTLMILKEPGYDALCVERIVWQRTNISDNLTVEDPELLGPNLLGDSTVMYLNGPEDYVEESLTDEPLRNDSLGFEYDDCDFGGDEDRAYICDPDQATFCSDGLFTNTTTQAEAPCLDGWRFFNLQNDADYEYELTIEGCSGSGNSTGATASFCPNLNCDTSDVVEQTLGNFDSSGATIFLVKLGFNPVAIRLSASGEEGWCANAMSFNGFTLAGSYPYEMDANETRIIKNIQYFGAEPTSTSSSDGESLWPRRRSRTRFFHELLLDLPALFSCQLPVLFAQGGLGLGRMELKMDASTFSNAKGKRYLARKWRLQEQLHSHPKTTMSSPMQLKSAGASRSQEFLLGLSSGVA
ncbi:unnamed protein product [Scytosiphon promiscuus]